jgi:hypothetical protein
MTALITQCHTARITKKRLTLTSTNAQRRTCTDQHNETIPYFSQFQHKYAVYFYSLLSITRKAATVIFRHKRKTKRHEKKRVVHE